MNAQDMTSLLVRRLVELLRKQDKTEQAEAMSEISRQVWESLQATVHNGSLEAFARNLFQDHPELAERALAQNFNPAEVDDPADLVSRLLPSGT